MAHPSMILINSLRETSNRLKDGAKYHWGDHGACNCGNLLQVVCKLSKEEILAEAHTVVGEWTEIAQEYCSSTSVPISLMIKKLSEIGLTPVDIHHIEYLDDREVLHQLPGGFRWLQKNQRQDVILYLETMADLLEKRLLKTIEGKSHEADYARLEILSY